MFSFIVIILQRFILECEFKDSADLVSKIYSSDFMKYGIKPTALLAFTQKVTITLECIIYFIFRCMHQHTNTIRKLFIHFAKIFRISFKNIFVNYVKKHS